MSDFYVDMKYTIWQRAHFSGDFQGKIISLLKQGKADEIFDEELGFIENDILYGTEERLSPEENDNQATIEMFNEKEDPIFTNSK